MGRLLQEESLLPNLIITSTAKRARQTVERLVAASGYTGTVATKAVFYLAGPSTYLRVLREVKDDPQRVMVVGHNPGLEELVNSLTSTSTTMPSRSSGRDRPAALGVARVGRGYAGRVEGSVATSRAVVTR